MNGKLDQQKLQDAFKYSSNPKLLPPTSQNLFSNFRRARINCNFDLIHRIVNRQQINLTLAVNYDNQKDELKLYMFQQMENTTMAQFELFTIKTNFSQYLTSMEDLKAVFDYSDAVMYVYAVDRKIKKTVSVFFL
uniref:Uncharacterized protein n=1 Tax=Panagrolaimus superbus TaxID=310955 RepID=A0A914YZX5_9BILA